MTMKTVLCSIAFLFLFGCGHTQSTKVGLMSFGDLQGKVLPTGASGPVLSGKSCGSDCRLSNAVHDALKGTQYDTLLNAVVTNSTSLFVWSNCIFVSGNGLDSRSLTAAGGTN